MSRKPRFDPAADVLLAERLELLFPRLMPFPGCETVQDLSGTFGLLVRPGSDLTRPLVEGLKSKGVNCLVVESELVTDEVLEQFSRERPSGLIHAAAVDARLDWQAAPYDALRSRLLDECGGLFKLAGVFPKVPKEPRRFLFSLNRIDSPMQAFFPAALKCLGLERTDLDSRAMVFHDALPADRIAGHLIRELSRPLASLVTKEVHVRDDRPVRRELVPAGTPAAGSRDLPFTDGKRPLTVLVTGGAQGILPGMLEELAGRGRFRLILTGRTPNETPSFSPAQLADEKQLIARLMESNQASTPAEARQAIGLARKQKEIQKVIAGLSQRAEVEYHACDVSDPRDLEGLIDQTIQRYGSIDGVLHAAGVVCNKEMTRHTAEDLAQVLLTKVMPLAVFARKLDLGALRFFVGFSSAASILGNARQSSYAGANAVLESFADRYLAPRAPQATTRVLCYSAWDGGMVTDGLKRIMASLQLSCIPAKLGNPTLADRLESRDGNTIAVYLTPDPYFLESIEQESRQRRLLSDLEHHPQVDEVIHLDPDLGCQVACTLGPEVRERLADHCFYEVPVVSGSVLGEIQRDLASAFLGRPCTLLKFWQVKEMTSLSEVQQPMAIRLTPAGEAAVACRIAVNGRERCEAILAISQSPPPDATRWPALISPRQVAMDQESFYSAGAFRMGPRFRVLGLTNEVTVDGVDAGFVIPDDRPAFETIFEACGQAVGGYCLVNYDFVPVPYRIEGLRFAEEFPPAGTGCRLRFRRRLLPITRGLCVVDFLVEDEQGRPVAWGGPWTSVLIANSERSITDEGLVCRHVRLSRLSGMDSFLKKIGTCVRDVWLCAEERQAFASDLGGAEQSPFLAAVVAAKESVTDLLRQQQLFTRAEEVRLFPGSDGNWTTRQPGGRDSRQDMTVGISWSAYAGAAVAVAFQAPRPIQTALLPVSEEPEPEVHLTEQEIGALSPMAALRGALYCRVAAAAAKIAASRLVAEAEPDRLRITFLDEDQTRLCLQTDRGDIEAGLARIPGDGGDGLLAWARKADHRSDG